MKDHTELSKKIQTERIRIVEMIEASRELSEKKGKHPLESGCCCISCVNQRKRLLEGSDKEWKFKI